MSANDYYGKPQGGGYYPPPQGTLFSIPVDRISDEDEESRVRGWGLDVPLDILFLASSLLEGCFKNQYNWWACMTFQVLRPQEEIITLKYVVCSDSGRSNRACNLPLSLGTSSNHLKVTIPLRAGTQDMLPNPVHRRSMCA